MLMNENKTFDFIGLPSEIRRGKCWTEDDTLLFMVHMKEDLTIVKKGRNSRKFFLIFLPSHIPIRHPGVSGVRIAPKCDNNVRGCV